MFTANRKVAAIAVITISLAIGVFIAVRYQQSSSHKRAPAAGGMQAKKANRRITAPRFTRQFSGTAAKTPEEASDIEASKAEEMPVPEEVPTAQSSDDEIRSFLAWLSNLGRENISSASKETETRDSDEEGEGADYDREKPLIESVIWEKWKKGYETYDLERYMSAIWEDDFFYTSDMGTPDDPADDVIFRGGQQERESALRVFERFTKGIELNLSPRSDVEFLSNEIAMVKYDYELKLFQTPSPESKFEAFYAPGNMTIILERRETLEGVNEWRILEWYEYGQE